MPERRKAATVTAPPQSDLVPSHIRFFARLIAGNTALLMSDMTKARFNPRRKVIGFRSCFFWLERRRRRGTDVIAEARFRLARHLFQFGKWSIDRAGAGLAGVFDDAVEPAVDKLDRALARL